MGAAVRLLVAAAAIAGGLSASQLPEFAQQYRQRLGGALEEIRQVVEDFDADAARNRLTRAEALQVYGRSAEAFLRDRGASMARILARYEALVLQRERLDSAPPLWRPIVVLAGPDERVVRGAWADFEPALPLTMAGLVWAGLGVLVSAFAATIIVMAMSAGRRRIARRA